MWKADRRIWLTEDRERAVEDGDPEARFLLAGGPGVEVPDDVADRYGLKSAKAQTTEAEPEQTAEDSPQLEDKALRGSKESSRSSRSRSRTADDDEEGE